ncbi:hypothetical protein [Paenibacillus sp. MMS20-IR301]|uniref:hypothetical protein n=1 Tax=Paenibacillus sp. MMS20-IR301 TaxID=2895946 RepID=UPI0028E5FAF9|nr:hypothetical protein [Paenibacillus sp. MMS20-IR301]WNS42974.1 hypothetical protein LOS79_29070 [Paenibacillus sp. MMS20-IR301]
MKKLASLTVAMGLMASIAATASAAEVTGTTTTANTDAVTVSETTYVEPFDTVITPEDIKPATPQIILTKLTAFHLAVGSLTPIGWLGAQTVDTTGVIQTDTWGNEWREVYTWLGKAWIKIPASAYVITP